MSRQGKAVSTDRELPPKSLATQGILDAKREALSRALGSQCDYYRCFNLAQAKDYLRSHTCSIYGTLREAYSSKINLWQWEDAIANEAIRIAYSCWKNLSLLPDGAFSREELMRSIVQHVGRPLNSIPLIKPVMEATSSDAPLLAMAKAAVKMAGPITPPISKSRLSPMVTAPQAARKLEKYLSDKGVSQTDFAGHAQTTDRTLRNFRSTGKVRKDIFENIAKAMQTTKDDLMM